MNPIIFKRGHTSDTKSTRGMEFFTLYPFKLRSSWGPLISVWKRPNVIYQPHQRKGNEDSEILEQEELKTRELEIDAAFEEKINAVTEMFPDIARHIIACSLEDNGEDVQKTIDNLLTQNLPKA